jgi:hypothetical protein
MISERAGLSADAPERVSPTHRRDAVNHDLHGERGQDDAQEPRQHHVARRSEKALPVSKFSRLDLAARRRGSALERSLSITVRAGHRPDLS